ncbi:hypothetical protein [Streptomyces luteogriseus]|uniref:hypothetical protein n=1 Tax=Streptomyces luteogriseus TaxID=68233 RepID=UPI00382C1969
MEHLIDRQRARYQALLELADRPFDVERPAVFSPAAAGQDETNVKGLLFRWTPVFIPYEYSNWGEESLAHVRSCYIGDWSAIGKLRVRGTEALTALTRIGMNNLSRFEPGRSSITSSWTNAATSPPRACCTRWPRRSSSTAAAASTGPPGRSTRAAGTPRAR